MIPEQREGNSGPHVGAHVGNDRDAARSEAVMRGLDHCEDIR